MDTLFQIMAGVGLSAACGFRVFVPLLIMGVAARTGHLHLGDSLAWIGSPAALVASATATLVEIGGYYLPWVDHALDTVATPAAVAAGILTTGAMASDLDPWLGWTAATILGGGAAGAVQATSVVLRGISTASTGGLGNPVVSTAETGGAFAMATTAVLWPVLAMALWVSVLWLGGSQWRKRRRRQSSTAEPQKR